MARALTIARRELKSYFDAPVAYIVVVGFLAVAGWILFSSLFLLGRADMRTFFQPSPFSPSMLLVILVPAITMRLVAEERRSGTLELLTTLPVRDIDVILGKFFAAFGLVASALLVTVVYALTINGIGHLDWGPVISGYLGMLLFAATLVAVGLLCSSLTENQIVAFIIGFLVSAALYFILWLQFFMPAAVAPVVAWISTSSHLQNMARGVIDSRDVLYFLTVTAGALTLAVRALARRHA